MGKYSGYQLCSDVDGTLVYDGKISDKNREAISYFISEGGIFTVATGRPPFHLETMDFKCAFPTIAINGTLIYDEKARKTLWKSPMSEKAIKADLEAHSHAKNLDRIAVFFEDEMKIANSHKELREYFSCGREIFKTVACFGDEENALLFRKYVSDTYKDTVEIDRSWSTGVEIHGVKTGKSYSIKEYRKLFPEIHTSVAVGDYENDLLMIRDADIGYAVDNAIPEVKAVAKRTAPHCKDSAIAYVIEDILR